MSSNVLDVNFLMTFSLDFLFCRNIYGIPLNLLVVSVFLSIKSLGVQGALGCATAALGVASVCMNVLNTMIK